jgi:opacity protein-like surface antigen
MSMKRQTVGVVALVLLMAGAVAGFAAEPQGWKIEITPYAWLAGLEGDITVNGQKTDFEKSASDLLDAVDMGASVRLGASYDRFLVGALVDYFSLSTDELDVEDQPQGGSLDSKMLLTEVAAGYRVDGWSEGQSFGLMVGVRNLHMENDLSVVGTGDISKDNDAIDGMVYVLPSMPMFPSKIDGLRFNPVLGIVAGDSDLAFELFPQVQYQITDTVAARLGYRTVGWEFKDDNNGDNELNVRLAGLIAGVGVTF